MGCGCGKWLAAAWFFSSSAFAGSWIGGGGELLGDVGNPWFLANTPTVTACVTMDAEHFHLPAAKPDPLHDFIEPALAYWQHELQLPTPSVSLLKVGTQVFAFGPCAEDTQLRIQLGSLSAKQMQEMQNHGLDPRRLVSLAVRTDYDPVSMRGKGFVYVAADSGLLRPNSSELYEQPWADETGSHLLNVLAHELGHVFGLPHTTDSVAGGLDLMNAAYPEAILNRYRLDVFGPPRFGIPPFFREDSAGSVSNHCRRGPLSARVAVFLGAEASVRCLRFKQHGSSVAVFAYHAGNEAMLQPGEILGTIQLSEAPAFKLAENILIRVFLPPEQTVVPRPAINLKSNTQPGLVQYVGPKRSTYNQTGIYTSVRDRLPRSMLVARVAGGKLRVAGLLDGGELLDFAEAAK